MAGMGLQEVPGGHQVKGGVGGSEPTDVDDAGRPPFLNQHVSWYQVTVGHCVSCRPWQFAHLLPEAPEFGNVDEVFAVAEAHVHPGVVSS